MRRFYTWLCFVLIGVTLALLLLAMQGCGSWCIMGEASEGCIMPSVYATQTAEQPTVEAAGVELSIELTAISEDR